MSLARRVIHGIALITMASAGGRLLAILTVPILSPPLGSGPYGVAALVGTIVSLGKVLALLGIDMAYARFLQEDMVHRAAVERFCWRFAAVGALMSALLAGSLWFCLGGRWRPDHDWIAAYSTIAIILTVSCIMATTRIRLYGNYRRVASALFSASVSSAVVSIGIALYWRADEWALLGDAIVATTTALVILGVPCESEILTPSALPKDKMLAIISLGLAGGVTAPMYWIISSVDRWFITEFDSLAEMAVYSMAVNVALLGLMLNSALPLTWFPEASRVYRELGSAALALLEECGRD